MDGTHFHTLAAAIAATGGIVTIEPGASPDARALIISENNLTIQGDPNVPATILPSENITFTGANGTLTNLNLGTLQLGVTPGNTSTSGNYVSKCLIYTLIENGVSSIFTQNTITHGASFNGVQSSVGGTANNDQVSNNLFTKNNGIADLQIFGCDGTIVEGNVFYVEEASAIQIVNSGQATFTSSGAPLGFCRVENNTITSLAGSERSGAGITVNTQIGSTNIYIINNSISTQGGIGLSLAIAELGNSSSALIQGNDFHGNKVGLRIVGGGPSAGNIDLGGGSIGGIASSLGGNDFRSFNTEGTLDAAAVVLLTSPNVRIPAAGNIFHAGTSPGFVVDDGVEGSLTGSGELDAGAKLDDVHAFVQGLYNDLLGRTGTMAELNLWVSVYDTQGQAAVANGIFRSSESLGRIVDSFYLRFLGRQSDDAGRSAWINILQHGASLESVEAGFITSPEYLGRIDTDFVQSLYINLLGRTGSAAELALWNNDIQPLGLAGIANAFLTSQEYRADNVTADFATFLHRPPSPPEISAFVAMPTDLLGIEAAILSSQECFTNI
ncbi:MAG TPA: hypothetical protein VGY66_05000 [Gemmataceae bacterium]|nr:hypothetical protein [Gemmataceae bacterium]